VGSHKKTQLFDTTGRLVGEWATDRTEVNVKSIDSADLYKKGVKNIVFGSDWLFSALTAMQIRRESAIMLLNKNDFREPVVEVETTILEEAGEELEKDEYKKDDGEKPAEVDDDVREQTQKPKPEKAESAEKEGGGIGSIIIVGVVLVIVVVAVLVLKKKRG